MQMDKFTADIKTLPPDEKLDLIELLWESLSADPKAVPLTAAQREELDRRLDEVEAGQTSGIPWEEVLKRIRGGR
jgi:putative addiction module component (TIGR02574 family)